MGDNIHERIRGRKWMMMRRAVLDADPLCTICRKRERVTLATVVDHKIALMNGGTNERSNLHGLCKSCHDTKTETDKGRKPKQAIGADGWPMD